MSIKKGSTSRRIGTIILINTILAGLSMSSVSPSQASEGSAIMIASSVKKGANCTKLKQSVKLKGTKYMCLKAGSRKTWVIVSTKNFSSQDSSYFRTVVSYVRDDLSEANCRALDGIYVQGSLNLLSQDFDRFDTLLPAPPGIKPERWFAEVQTLGSFSAMAADEWASGDYFYGSVRLEVITTETIKLLKTINKSLGSTYTLPIRKSC
jgi:hypothetical protein